MPVRRNTVTPVNTGWNFWPAGGSNNVLNTSSGTDQPPVSGTIYWVGTKVDWNSTLTGISYTIGSVGGTDKVIVALYDNAGTLLANSATAGVTVGTASTKQQVAFTSTVAVTGPGNYFIALQFNGTTARFRTFSSTLENFVTGSVAGSFGTLPALTPGTTYTQSVGPFAVTY